MPKHRETVPLTYDSNSGRGRSLAARVDRPTCISGRVAGQSLPHFEATRPIDLGDDVLRRVVDVDLVLEPRHGGGRDADHVALKGQGRSLRHIHRLDVLGELGWDNLLVCLCERGCTRAYNLKEVTRFLL